MRQGLCSGNGKRTLAHVWSLQPFVRFAPNRGATVASMLLAVCISAQPCHAADPPTVSGIRNRVGGQAAAAGDVVDVLGSNLATDTLTSAGWPLPLISGTTTVSCNGVDTPILSSAPDRVRIQLPWELAGIASTQIQVTVAGQSSAPFMFAPSEFAPAIVDAGAPRITAGQMLTIRAIGLGPRTVNPPTGAGPSASAPGAVTLRFLVLIGGVPAPITATRLADTGDAQSDAGMEFVTVQIPANVPAGDNIPMQILIGGVTSDSFPISVAPTDLTIALSPSRAEVPISGKQKFVASVQGSGDTSLMWSIDANAYSLPNTGGGYGQMNGGLFDAASNMAVPNWTIVRATHKSGLFATALVQLVAQDGKVYRIVPESPAISAGETIGFVLLGPDGNTVEAAKWRISEGFGDYPNPFTAALRFAPSQVTVHASLPGTYGFLYDVASTIVLINPPRAQISGTSPSVGHVGEGLTVLGTGISARATAVWFPTADGTTVRVAGSYSATGSPFTVPHGAVSGRAWLEMSPGTGEGSTFLTPFQVTILPRLRLHAARMRVSSGETIQVTAAAPDVTGDWRPTWRADLGSVDPAGRFTAPAATRPMFARIWACLQQNVECGTTVVEVLPFRLDPDPAILTPGVPRRLLAWQSGGQVTPTWSAVTKNITVLPDGTATAGTGAFDGGRALVSATFGGVTQNFELSVRTAGSVANTAEYEDWLGYDGNSVTRRLALGVYSSTVAVHGDWVYALSRSLSYSSGPWVATWMDVYQLDANRNPVWVGALEAPYGLAGGNQPSLYLEGDILCANGQEDSNNAGSNVLICYDVSAGRPVWRSRQLFDGNPATYRHQGISVTVTPQNPPDPVTDIRLDITDYGSGKRSLPLHYKPLFDRYEARAAGTTGWAVVMFYYPFGQSGNNYETVVFDTTGVAAEPIALLASGGLIDSITLLQDLLVVSGDVYQVSGNNVTFVSQIPVRNVVDSDPAGKRLLGTPDSQSEGYRVVDLTDAANPRISAPVEHPSQYVGSAALGADYFVLPGQPQNVMIYPITYSPGIRLLDRFPASPPMNELRIRNGYLYWTGAGFGFAGRGVSRDVFEVVDVSSSAFRAVATQDRPGDETGWAIELAGHYAYVGTDAELIVYDIGSPASPTLKATIQIPAISLAISGNYLYVGSFAGKNPLLIVYDISDPGNPRQSGQAFLPSLAYGMTAQAGGWQSPWAGRESESIRLPIRRSPSC